MMLRTGMVDSQENVSKIIEITDESIKKYNYLTNLPIFSSIAKREELTFDTKLKKNACNVCRENMKKNIYCGFCGKLTCKKHLVKLRKAPINNFVESNTEFIKICQNCEDKFIELEFIEKFACETKKWREIMERMNENGHILEQNVQIKDKNVLALELEIKDIVNDPEIAYLKAKTEAVIN